MEIKNTLNFVQWEVFLFKIDLSFQEIPLPLSLSLASQKFLKFSMSKVLEFFDVPNNEQKLTCFVCLMPLLCVFRSVCLKASDSQLVVKAFNKKN